MPNNNAQRQGSMSFLLYAVLTIALLPVATKLYNKWISTSSKLDDPFSQLEPGMNLEEYITLCASLHSQLLSKTIPPPRPQLVPSNNENDHDSPVKEPEPKEFEKTLLQRYQSFAKAPFTDYYLDKTYIPPTITQDAPILSLMSQLQTTAFKKTPPPSGDDDDPNLTYTPGIALTPLLYQPVPEWFFPELFFNEHGAFPSVFRSSERGDGEACNCILLYPQRIYEGYGDPGYDGGIFVDMYTLKAVWNDGSPEMGPGEWPPKRDWVGLDVILRRELKKWEMGRYTYIEDENGGGGYGQAADKAVVKSVRYSPYVHPNHDNKPGRQNSTRKEPATVLGDKFPNMQVFEAIQQWDRLLNAIEEKMHSQGYINDEMLNRRLFPISPHTLHAPTGNIKISQFAKDFLTRARRPTWTFVAPGITVFTDETLAQIYSTENRDSRRLLVTYDDDSSYDWTSLILPGERVIDADVKGYDPRLVRSETTSGDSYHFDKPYGFGQFTLDRRAGLYTMPWTEWDGDLVTLVMPSGNTQVGRFNGRCPWGPHRQPRLAETLAHWAGLVERGVWNVDERGVVGGGGWFEKSDGNLKHGNLDWRDFQEGI